MLARIKQVNQLFELAEKEHWGVRVVRDGGMIDSPVYQNEWWYIPVEMDDLNSTPKFVQERMDLILESKIPVNQLIIRHEAPKLLAAPKTAEVETSPIEIPWDEIKKIAGVTAKVLAVLAAGMAMAPVVLLGGMLMMLDPAICVVLEDGTVVECARWEESL